MIDQDQTAEPASRLRLPIVLVLVIAAAGVFSYLSAVAIPHALVQAELINPWPANPDPRPLWFGYCFGGLLGTATLAALTLRLVSRRQLFQIDSITDAAAEPENDLLTQRPPTRDAS